MMNTEELDVSGRHGPIPARFYRPEAEKPHTGFVWFHGGGFIGGDLDMPEADWVSRSLALQGFAVVSGDYRKCVEGVHYPVPNDDVFDLWMWVSTHATELGIDPAHLHLGGASAGGALAASATKRLRDGDGPTPKSLVLVYPVLHLELVEPDDALRETLQRTPDGLITPEIARSLSDNYLGDNTLRSDPYAVPSNGDLAALPPTYILNAEIDSLRASGEAYAAGLAVAGVESRVEYEPDARHGHMNDPTNVQARESLSRITNWLQDH